MNQLLSSALDLLLGAAGIILYLYLWNRALLSTAAVAGEVSANRIRRRRRRIWQILFFVGMTPYVLFLFYFMERAQGSLVAGDKPTQAAEAQSGE